MPYGLSFLVEDDRNSLMYRKDEGCQPTPDNWSKLDDSDELREQRGNRLFREDQYELAFETYARAFLMIPYAKRCELQKSDDQDNKIKLSYFRKCHDSAAKCLSNAAACVLKDMGAKDKYFDFYGLACFLCKLALRIDPTNQKAKYRLGLAMFMDENFLEAALVFSDLQNAKTVINDTNQIVSHLRICKSKIEFIKRDQEAKCEKIFEDHEKISLMLQFGKFKDAYRLQCKNLLTVVHLLLTNFDMDVSIQKQLNVLSNFYQTGAAVLMWKTLSKDDFVTIYEKECDSFFSANFVSPDFWTMAVLARGFLSLEMYQMANSIYKRMEPYLDRPAICPIDARPTLKFMASYASAMASKEADYGTPTNQPIGKGGKSRNRR